MLIVCPSCASRYSIDDDKIGEQGRMVRCANCRNDFFVVPPAPEPAAVLPPVSKAEAPRAKKRTADDDLADAWLAEAGLEPEPEPEPVAVADHLQTVTEDIHAEAQPRDLDAGIDQTADLDGETAPGLSSAAARPTLPPKRAGFSGLLARLKPGAKAKALHGPKANRSDRTGAGNTRPAARSRGQPQKAGRGSLARFRGPVALAAAGIITIAGLVWQREHVVSIAPASAALFAAAGMAVNLDGLTIDQVRSTLQREGEARFLLVEGRVVSISADAVRVPMIEVRVHGTDRQTLYTWTTEPPRSTLRPGETLHFRTRLATPPEAGRGVEVRFTTPAHSTALRN